MSNVTKRTGIAVVALTVLVGVGYWLLQPSSKSSLGQTQKVELSRPSPVTQAEQKMAVELPPDPLRHEPASVAAVPAVVMRSQEAGVTPVPLTNQPVTVDSQDSSSNSQPKEIPAREGTVRMYAAHGPLRAPEVADPDSKANRQILQQMVTKALARAAESNKTAQTTP